MSDKRRDITDQRYIHFLTFSTYRRRQLLELDQPKRIVLGVLNHQFQQMQGKCVGFVLMPNHVHGLIWLPDPKDLLRFVHGWKRMSSFEIRKWYSAHAPNYFRGFGPGRAKSSGSENPTASISTRQPSSNRSSTTCT